MLFFENFITKSNENFEKSTNEYKEVHLIIAESIFLFDKKRVNVLQQSLDGNLRGTRFHQRNESRSSSDRVTL